jgi:hypothetical protein
VNLVKCKICGEGYVIDCKDHYEAKYMGFKDNLTLRYKTCNACNSEFADEEDMRRNKEDLINFMQDALKRAINDEFK